MVKRLILLNGIAVILAVSHHAVNWSLNAMFWWTDRYMATVVPNYSKLGGIEFYALRLIDEFVFGPPVFLFVSGYFVGAAAGPSEGKVGWKLLANRVKGLLPPYIIWSCATIVLNVVTGEQYSVSRFTWELLSGGAAAPFYYVPLLVELYVLSRWLVPIARHRSLTLLVVTTVIQLTVAVARSYAIVTPSISQLVVLRPLLNSHLAAYSFWFAFGLVVSAHLAQFKSILERLRPALPLLLVLVYVGATLEWDVLRRLSGRSWISAGVTVGDNLFCLMALLSLVAFDTLPVPWPAALGRIGAMSYGVYLVHTPVIVITAKGVYHLAPAILAYPLVFQILLTVVGLTVPLVLMSLVKRSPFSRHYQFLFG